MVEWLNLKVLSMACLNARVMEKVGNAYCRGMDDASKGNSM